MTRKFLEEMGLSKEQIDKILDENSQDIGKAKGDLEGVQTKLKNAEQEITNLKGQVKDRDGQLETLKASTGDVDDLKQKIETLQKDNKSKDAKYAAEIKQLKVDAAVSAALTSAKAKNIVAVKALLKDLDKAEFTEDGKIKGLSEQIDALIKDESSSFLFEKETKKTFKGTQPGQSGDEGNDGKVDTSKMTYSELAQYLVEHPEAKID